MPRPGRFANRPYRDAGRCWEAGDRELKRNDSHSKHYRPGCRPTRMAGARSHRIYVCVDSRPIRSEGGLGCLVSVARRNRSVLAALAVDGTPRDLQELGHSGGLAVDRRLGQVAIHQITEVAGV